MMDRKDLNHNTGMPEDPKVSVIIPTLNAEAQLPGLLEMLAAQTRAIHEIIVVDSASDDGTVGICKGNDAVDLIRIERSEFDHGRTRDMALRKSAGDIVVFLGQDAVPANGELLDRLIAPLGEDKVAVSTGRQLPKADASKMERLVRAFNYPERSHIRSKEDVPRMGIKAFFCSDVCAAYDRESYLKLGGFLYPVRTNEDMFFAATAIREGYRVAYAADALVYHSHDLTPGEQYRRNYNQGYEMEKHKDLLGNVEQEKEGKRLVSAVSGELLRRGNILAFAHFGLDCCARLMGSRAGKRAYRREAGQV